MIRNQTFEQENHHTLDFRGFLLDKNQNSRQQEGVSASHIVEIVRGKIKIRLPIQNIIYVRGEHVYARIHFVNDQQIVQRISLKNLLTQLPEDIFLRIHRSYLINSDYVQAFSSKVVVMAGGHKLPVGRSRRKEVFSRLTKKLLE